MPYFKQKHLLWHQSEEARKLLNGNQLLVLQEVLENEPDLENELSHILLWSEITIVNRLLSWLKGLNEANGFYSASYNTLVVAILWAFNSDTPITRQTQHQFEISLNLLQDFLRFRIPVTTNSDARYLLMNVFMLSERPDLCIRSITKEMKRYNEGTIETTFHRDYGQLLQYLFVSAPLPTFLFPYLNKCSFKEYKIILQILDGKGLRSLLPTEFKLSKSENAVLQTNAIQLPETTDHILERFVLAARILIERPTSFPTLNRMLHASKIFKDQFASFRNDIIFWKSVFRFLSDNIAQLREASDFLHYVDFFEAQRYFCESPLTYSLKGRTFASVERAAQNWQIGIKYNMAHTSYSWNPLPIEKWMSFSTPFSYVIEEITDGKRLLAESTILNHCVFSYAYSCNAGHIHIFSLSKLKNNVNKPYATIEVRGKFITEVAGKMNISPSRKAMELIKEWGQLNHLSIRLKTNGYI
ncbi:Hypothetical protein I595_2781 [Croceitalea dokdonensis DOKDO 023]|uniref:Uncharacterized protein n=1 Tax=Croceitalea dokdonensis DOKDO 023 TaxID=1300341 RepID=A0A0P7AT05_9FLAO|nr:PcfJ domain-containing protein [Croceitalea dokdonensis]KPM31514.1 Hypothetical protein I595_2781 [Croceitalea dokdonensis DOKDO 023]